MKPEPFRQEAEDYRRIEAALRYVVANFRRQPDLEAIAASVHLSKFHFQRLFRRWAGVTPTQFLQVLTVDYAKERLKEAESLLDTALAAGLSGPGRLHDLFVTLEAMTPGEYKRQGEGLAIQYGLHPTPFGDCLLATTDRGICALRFVGDDPEVQLAELRAEWPRSSLLADAGRTGPLVARLFRPDDADDGPALTLLLKGTNFQVQVWRALLSLPAGAMVSYQQLAGALGRPTAGRAVAGAVARNPVGYVIPCHRVINSLGQSHRYRWGATRKRAILGWEASRRPALAGAAD